MEKLQIHKYCLPARNQVLSEQDEGASCFRCCTKLLSCISKLAA